MPAPIQYGFVAKFGTSYAALNDNSIQVHKGRLLLRSTSVVVPASAANSLERTYAGNKQWALELDYSNYNASQTAYLDNLFLSVTTGATPNSTVFAEVIFDNASPVSATNKRYRMECTVLEYALGGTPGQVRMETITLPVVAYTFTDS